LVEYEVKFLSPVRAREFRSSNRAQSKVNVR
jgi:hypothetical protein